MIFKQLNPHSCWTYLIGREGSKEVALVDPVLDHVDDYIRILDEEGYRLAQVVDTHTHADHITGAPALKDRTGCEYLMHEKAPAQCVTVRLRDGDEFTLAGYPVRAIHTPGHTQDGICLVFPRRILTGDTLFLDDGGAGRDDLPGGDPENHFDSLQRIKKLPDYLTVYPAHEYRDRTPSSLGDQKRTNPHLGFDDKKEFQLYIDDLRLGPADWMKDVLRANYHCAMDPQSAWIPADVPACEVKGTAIPTVNAIQVDGIDPGELHGMISDGKKPVLIDVREPQELDDDLGAIEGAENIPIGQLIDGLTDLETSRDREVVMICRSGARAYTAAQILKHTGFSSVRALDGGMMAWRSAGY